MDMDTKVRVNKKLQRPENGCVVLVLACGGVLRGASVPRWSAWPRGAARGTRPGRARIGRARPARAQRVHRTSSRERRNFNTFY